MNRTASCSRRSKAGHCSFMPKGFDSRKAACYSLTVMDAKLRQTIDTAIATKWDKGTVITRIDPLAGDASSRSYARLHLSGGGPATTVAMVLSGSALPLSSDELAVFKEPLKELPYLNVYRFLKSLGVAVPETYYDGSGEGFLLLEDIGDVPLREAAQGLTAAKIEELYRRAIDQLVRLQVEGTRRSNESCIAFQQAFDHRLFMWEFEHFIEWGLEKREGKPLSVTEGKELRSMFDEVSTRLDRSPRFLNHRDYHSW